MGTHSSCVLEFASWLSFLLCARLFQKGDAASDKLPRPSLNKCGARVLSVAIIFVYRTTQKALSQSAGAFLKRRYASLCPLVVVLIRFDLSTLDLADVLFFSL